MKHIISDNVNPVYTTGKRKNQLLLYKRVLTAAIAFCSALFELATGEKAPKTKDVLREEVK